MTSEYLAYFHSAFAESAI